MKVISPSGDETCWRCCVNSGCLIVKGMEFCGYRLGFEACKRSTWSIELDSDVAEAVVVGAVDVLS